MNFELLSVLALAGSSFGQVIFDRNCPERPVESHFNLERYVSAPWFDLMRYNVRFIPDDCECGFAHLTLQADKSVKVQNCCRRIQTDENTRCSIGKALVSFPDADPLEARLNVSFFGRPNDNSNYWVLSTDYDHYSLVYHCTDMGPAKSAETFWLLSRTPIIDASVKPKTDEFIDKYFDRSQMKIVNHTSEKCDNPEKLKQ